MRCHYYEAAVLHVCCAHSEGLCRKYERRALTARQAAISQTRNFSMQVANKPLFCTRKQRTRPFFRYNLLASPCSTQVFPQTSETAHGEQLTNSSCMFRDMLKANNNAMTPQRCDAIKLNAGEELREA